MDSVKISFLIGMVFSPLAALFAFLLTYNEYSRHFMEKKIVLKHSFEAGVFTLLVFLVISLLIGVFISRGL